MIDGQAHVHVTCRSRHRPVPRLATDSDPCIVVLGHADCIAVKSACDDIQLDNLTATLSNLMPAVKLVITIEGARSSKNMAFVQRVTVANVNLTVASLTARSSTLRSLVDEDQLKVGAMYDVATGHVTFTE